MIWHYKNKVEFEFNNVALFSSDSHSQKHSLKTHNENPDLHVNITPVLSSFVSLSVKMHKHNSNISLEGQRVILHLLHATSELVNLNREQPQKIFNQEDC